MKRIIATVVLVAAGSWNCAHGALVITSTEAAPDGGIIIRWSSEADKIYRIDYAPELTEPMKWSELYTDYPSHGPATFWKDVGNQFAFPSAGHPADGAMRFYRLVEIGANTASKPTVSITSPAQSSTVSDTITVNSPSAAVSRWRTSGCSSMAAKPRSNCPARPSFNSTPANFPMENAYCSPLFVIPAAVRRPRKC